MTALQSKLVPVQICIWCVLSCVPKAQPSQQPHAASGTASAKSAKPTRLDNSRERIAKLSQLPANTIAGPDEDRDHIRDDIAQYIDAEYSGDEHKRLAARQYARAEEHELVYADDRDRAFEAASEATRAIECLYAHYAAQTADAVWGEIQARTVDTEERLRAHARFHKAISGGYFEAARDPGASCAFDSRGLAP